MKTNYFLKKCNDFLSDIISEYQLEGVKINFRPKIELIDDTSFENNKIVCYDEEFLKQRFLKKLYFKQTFDEDLPEELFEKCVERELKSETFNVENKIVLRYDLLDNENLNLELRRGLWNLIQYRKGFYKIDFLNEGVSSFIYEKSKGDAGKYFKLELKENEVDMFHDMFSKRKKNVINNVKERKQGILRLNEDYVFQDVGGFVVYDKMKENEIKDLLNKNFRKETFRKLKFVLKEMYKQIKFN